MRKYIKKTAACLIAMTMVIGTVEVMPKAEVMAAEEIDGDVVENPWADLFKDNTDGNQDLVIDNDGNNNNNTEKEETTTTQADNKAVSSLKKQLKTKVVSATKKSKKAKKAKVVLKKVKKAVSYQVRYSTTKKFKKYKTKTSKKTKITLKKLKAGKKYYVKARAVGKLNGVKVYGKWTKRKTIKVKKK